MTDSHLPETAQILGGHGELSEWSRHLNRLKIPNADSAVVLLPLDWTVKKIRTALDRARKTNSILSVIGVGHAENLETLKSVLAENLVDVVADRQADEAACKRALARAQALVAKRRRAAEDLIKSKDHNRHLEQLGESLEDTVRKRTKSAADSKTEVEKRVTQLRLLLRFMQDLATAVGPEDVLKFLRQELKIFHRVREPALAFFLSSGEKRLIYFRAGQVFERTARRAWPQSPGLRRNEPGDSQYLADEFGRPVNRVLAIPLISRETQSEQLQPTLFFEHQLKDHEIDQFLTFINARLQVVNVALDRLLLEFDLRSATYLWEHTFDGLEDPVAIVDLDRRLLRSNRAFVERAQRESCHMAFNNLHQACTGCPMPKVFESGKPEQGLVRRGGEMFTVHSYPILMDPDEKPTTVVNHYLNVTEDLALHERMMQTEKMAALGHLAGHIAHELNNPLTGIRGLAQVCLADPSITKQLREDLQEIEKAAGRCQTIIADLLQFAAPAEGDQVARADLKQIIEKTLPLLKTALSPHEVDVDLGNTPAWTRVTPQLMQQVVFNLLKNACQALPGKGRIEVRLAPVESAAGAFWQISIRDNGIGIAPENMRNLFSPFYTTKAEGEGTGLGLSLSRGLARRFGGEIEVSSTLGEGTEFRVLLPREAQPT